MKKTVVRVVALVLLAVMVLSVVPAFASGIIGTITNTTDMHQKANTSSKVVASVKGTVNVLYQNNEGTMYQVSMTYNGQTYTGWAETIAGKGGQPVGVDKSVLVQRPCSSVGKGVRNGVKV